MGTFRKILQAFPKAIKKKKKLQAKIIAEQHVWDEAVEDCIFMNLFQKHSTNFVMKICHCKFRDLNRTPLAL